MAKSVKGNAHPNAAGVAAPKPVDHMSSGAEFNGDWPADGLLVGGCHTADVAGEHRGIFVAPKRGVKTWKGAK